MHKLLTSLVLVSVGRFQYSIGAHLACWIIPVPLSPAEPYPCACMLLQPPLVVYVDNAQSTAAKWEEILPSVIVKQDPWHLQQRILRAVGDSEHPAYNSFRGAISRAMFDVVEEDMQGVKDILDNPNVLPATKMRAWRSCRKAIPAGAVVYSRLAAVLHNYKQAAGVDFITPATEQALQNQESSILAGQLTDPMPVEFMYYRDIKNVLRSHRSESQAENVIGR